MLGSLIPGFHKPPNLRRYAEYPLVKRPGSGSRSILLAYLGNSRWLTLAIVCYMFRGMLGLLVVAAEMVWLSFGHGTDYANFHPFPHSEAWLWHDCAVYE